MASSLSKLVDNLAKGIHKNKFKCRKDHKKCEKCENYQKKLVKT